jgi:CheY-like chemotaxis protein
MNSAQIVTFFLTSAEERAWVVIRGACEAPRVVEMWNGYANHWSATAWLRPGEYQCRYYCGDSTHAVYHGPAQMNGKAGKEMDGLVSVDSPQHRKKSGPIQILVVEDNLTSLEAYAKLLRGDGCVVHVAEGYQSALAIARVQALDLAICDINLWDGDGCDLLSELKLLQPIKAIAITGYSLPEETEHYRDAGFSAVLRKPVHHSEIMSAISEFHFDRGASEAELPGLGN